MYEHLSGSLVVTPGHTSFQYGSGLQGRTIIDNWKGSLHNLVSYMLLELGNVEHGVDHGRSWQIKLIGYSPHFGDHLVRAIIFCS